ncbi:MAG: RNA polymerase sigma-70 factor [Reichenbachiella sp.]
MNVNSITTNSLKAELCLFRDGDSKAFGRIYERYVDKLYFYSLKFVKSPEIAEEIVQGVFVKIWEIRAKINLELSFDAFLYQITKNQTLNFLKRQAYENRFKEQLIPIYTRGIDATENQILMNETSSIIHRAIDELPEKRQAIYRMSRLEGLDHNGIATKLGISKNTVKVQIVKATKFVRSYYATYSV